MVSALAPLKLVLGLLGRLHGRLGRRVVHLGGWVARRSCLGHTLRRVEIWSLRHRGLLVRVVVGGLLVREAGGSGLAAELQRGPRLRGLIGGGDREDLLADPLLLSLLLLILDLVCRVLREHF